MTSMTQKLYNYLGWPTIGGWNYTESIALNMKLWPKLKINRWPSYHVINMYNITGICQFHRSVASCDEWFTYKGTKLHRFYCIFITIKGWLMPYWNSFTFKYGHTCSVPVQCLVKTRKKKFDVQFLYERNLQYCKQTILTKFGNTLSPQQKQHFLIGDIMITMRNVSSEETTDI